MERPARSLRCVAALPDSEISEERDALEWAARRRGFVAGGDAAHLAWWRVGAGRGARTADEKAAASWACVLGDVLILDLIADHLGGTEHTADLPLAQP